MIMKTIKNRLLIISILFLVYGCEKNMIDFQGDNGVYFEMRKKTPTGLGVGQCTDTTEVTFSSTQADDSTINVRLTLFGRIVNYDRTVNLKIIDTSTTAQVGIDLEEFPTKIVFPAGKEFTIFKIKFLRTEGILNNHKLFTIAIDKSPDFPFQLETYKSHNPNSGNYEFDDVTKHVFDISDALYQPPVWSEVYLGIYSDYKFGYINEMFGLTQDDWLTQQTMPSNRITYISRTMKRHILEQEAAGTPLYEKDRKGEIVYQKDAKGEYILDKDGNKIPVKLTMGSYA